eukprot:TRINITY_DN738_c0_g1_i1.p1 TRINITY_DN738_c0_g1~~TRINITY_DN738_c0_g1_i1.p1  ORF type:complete len:280 (+),score=68.82 TRINITY_DN738_c0_g1_i1:88-840(+)
MDSLLGILGTLGQDLKILIQLMRERRETSHQNQINLNIGGTRFSTSKATLTAMEGTYFAVMLSSTSEQWKPDKYGEYFIDRDPKHFDRILNYLRTGVLHNRCLNEDERAELKSEMEYYQIAHDERLPWHWDPLQKDSTVDLNRFYRTASVSAKMSGSVVGNKHLDSFTVSLTGNGSKPYPTVGLANASGPIWEKGFPSGVVSVKYDKVNGTITYTHESKKEVFAIDVPPNAKCYPFVKFYNGNSSADIIE